MSNYSREQLDSGMWNYCDVIFYELSGSVLGIMLMTMLLPLTCLIMLFCKD